MKKIILIFLTLTIVFSVAIIYVNQAILPRKAKGFVIRKIEEATKKKVTLEALEFSIFKGLVLRGLTLSDGKKEVLSAKEVSCTFLLFPLFKKNIIIPQLKIKSPLIFIERRSDNTFNLQDLIPSQGASSEKNNFGVLIYSLSVSAGRIDFRDNTVSPVFSKGLEDIVINARFVLPDRVKFSLKSEIPGSLRTKLTAAGEFKFADKQLQIKGSLKDLLPAEFPGYYQGYGFAITGGSVDADFSFKLKDGIADIALDTQEKGIHLVYAKTSVNLNADIEADIRYGLSGKKIAYSGKAKIIRSEVLGLEKIDSIRGIEGQVKFDDQSVTSDKLNAEILGIPIEAKVKLAGFNPSQLEMNLSADFNLGTAQKIIKERLNLVLPAAISGQGRLSASIVGQLPSAAVPLQISGSLDVRDSAVKLDKLDSTFENISGRLDFTSLQLKWSGLNFTAFGIPCKTSGILNDFNNPQVQLTVASEDLSLESQFSLREKILNLSQCNLRYLGSNLSLAGTINLSDEHKPIADVSGRCALNLKDTKNFFKEHKEEWEKAKPDGMVSAEFKLSGNPEDFKLLSVEAALSSLQLSLYGLRGKDLSLNYLQANGLADISGMRLSLYDGQAQGAAKMNLNTPNLPWWASLDIQGIRLEKLKLDTGLKEQDIAGVIQGEAKVNGSSCDLNRLNGRGSIMIDQGKLWQLNLFKGLGQLLFARDFADITFSGCACNFILQDKTISTDNLKLTSNLAELSGSLKLGFDSSIDATINVQVNDQTAPLSGTFKDVTTAIIGQGGRFGVIRITGTLKNPKYRFQPAVVSIMKSFKDALFGKPQSQ